MKEAPALSLLFNREEADEWWPHWPGENTDILLRCQVIPQKDFFFITKKKEKLFNWEEADDQGCLLGKPHGGHTCRRPRKLHWNIYPYNQMALPHWEKLNFGWWLCNSTTPDDLGHVRFSYNLYFSACFFSEANVSLCFFCFGWLSATPS